MNIPQIRLESTKGQIEMRTIQPKQIIEQKPAELSIEQPKAQLQIETTPGKLTIDQTRAREDVDLKSVFKRTEEFAQQGYNDWLSGLARVAGDGDELMKIENGFNALKSQAKRNSENPIYDFNIGWIPSAGSVKVNYEPAKVNIEAVPQKPRINVKINKPIHEYIPGQTDISLKQIPSLNIDFTNVEPILDKKY
ncbi:hypothetical protein JOC77_000290 [Peribacillus deserti]|uniref:YviE n=1 Tax=Peribacillus deserti TaxID=673318 RepID=A0ABS2QCJ8_9BACI|nr:DUF6470 family protein [Peribacillus deserti]MBM7690887.1 hypothetical protein [Peribacillus deserti]